MWRDHPFNQSNMTAERALGLGVAGDREVGAGVDKIIKKGGVDNGLNKIAGLALLCQLCKENRGVWTMNSNKSNNDNNKSFGNDNSDRS